MESEDSQIWIENSMTLFDALNSVPSGFYQDTVDGNDMSQYVTDLSIFNLLWYQIKGL